MVKYILSLILINSLYQGMLITTIKRLIKGPGTLDLQGPPLLIRGTGP
jgi:hypothetical protein